VTARASSWSTEQLTGFLGTITEVLDEETAVQAAVERAAEALDCEFGAFIRGERVVTSVGFPAGKTPERELLEAAGGEHRALVLPGGAMTRSIASPLADSDSGQIVVARLAGDPFLPEEVIVLRGMARVLAMTLASMRTVRSLQERQRLLELSTAIQRAITLRAPLQEVLDMICAAAAELLGDEVVWLRLVEPDDPRRTRTVATHGVDRALLPAAAADHVAEQDVGARAIAERRLVVVDDYAASPGAADLFVERGLQAAMAAPIDDEGATIGSLVVASYRPGRSYLSAEQEMLATFARHASLAFLDARTVDELVRQALHDPLTTLANRALFLDRLGHALARAERESTVVGVLFIDVDRFKWVNDNYGHAAGDALLVQVGERLRALTRSSDTVARLGGDEFAVLVEGVPEQSHVARLAAKLVESLRQPFAVEGDEISVTASLGVAVADSQTDDPLRDADHAMYRAKRGGNDRYEFFEPGMRAAMLVRLELEADLKGALQRGEFALSYQPIAELETGAIAGIEALIRWRHPSRGLLAPALFIPVAEETGMISAIGRWVLREACRRATGWQGRAHDGLRPFVSVNLAPVQLQQSDLVSETAEILSETGLDPSRLVLEITETSLLEDGHAVRTLRALKRLGIRLAVDDFGTGYSSLAYLQRFPLDALKIPKVFVDRLGRGSEGSALAQATIDLGRTFHLEVIAEGIERPEQLAELRRLGCSAGQGFLLSLPLDGGAIDALLLQPGAMLMQAVGGSQPSSAAAVGSG
jgi:diguanylate cyclase (GGDEF)-like protein